MCEISQLRRQKQRQAAAACSSGFRSELPAIIPLVLGGLPNKIPPSYPKGAPGQTAAHNVRPIPWKRRVRIARYSHQQVQLLLLSLGAQSRPVAVAVAVFVDTFFTACSLGCSFVRCHCQESHSESNQFRALASPRPEKLATCQTKPTASSPPPAALAACFPSGGLLLLPVLFGLKIKTHVSACGAHLHGISKVRATDRTDRADRTDTGSQRTNAIVLARCHRNATAGSSGVVLQPRPAFGVLTPLRCGTFMDYIANRARSSHSYSAVVACLFVCIWRHGGESVNRNMQNL